MNTTQPALRVSVDPDDVAVVRVDGELDLATAPDLVAYLQDRDGEVALDCSGLAFVDVAGLHAMVDAHAACRARGGRLVVLDPSPALLRLLRVVELGTILPMCTRNGRPLDRAPE